MECTSFRFFRFNSTLRTTGTKFIMKLITLLVALALAVIASAESNEEHKAKYLENVRICRGESGYSEEALMKLKSGNVADNSSEAKVIIGFYHFRLNLI